jgi:hypothetical protein
VNVDVFHHPSSIINRIVSSAFSTVAIIISPPFFLFNYSYKMQFSRVLFSAALLTTGSSAFTSQNNRKGALRSTTNLHMSAALIVQNKGGGHGELGK